MSEQVFVIRLKEAHDKNGLSPYMVAKMTGVAVNTVARYAENDEVVSKHLRPSVIILANYYGVDWRNPSIVDVLTVGEGDESPEMKTLVA